MKRVPVGDVELAVYDEGNGAPILFAHGFPLDHAMWRPQLDEFASSHRVIAPDLRGHGQSTVTPGTVSMERFADDLNGLLDELGVGRPVDFCGLSMGGYIAWQFARKYPQRLRSLVLCDTKAAADTPETVGNRYKMIDTLHAQGLKPIAEAMLPKLFAPATIENRPDIIEAARTVMLAADPEGVAAALRGMAERPDMTEFLKQVCVPTLVVVGSEDRITTVEDMRGIAATIAEARFVEVPQAGHMAPLEQPDRVNAVIRNFLEDHI